MFNIPWIFLLYNIKILTVSNMVFFEYILPHNLYIGFSNNIGMPKLPNLKFSLQIPGILYNESFSADNILCEYEEYSVNDFYLPYQDNFEGEDTCFYLDDEFYTLNNEELLHSIDVSNPFIAGNTTGIEIYIHPIQYNPVVGKVRIIKNISFDISIPLSEILAY